MMIRGSDISLYVACGAYFVMAIVIAGCDKVTPGGTGTPGGAASEVSPRNSNVEPTEQVAEREPGSAAEVVGTEAPSSTGEQPPASVPPTPSVPSSPASPSKAAKIALSVPEPPEYVYEPQVLMSQRDADSSLVKVGDAFPVAELSDLEGQTHSLKELFGEKLTVIVFWANSNRLGREQIQRLNTETIAPFDNTGLRVIAINIGDPAEQIRDLIPADSERDFTVLLDPNAALFSKVATDRHPRTYLLDATGQVLWFDIEYSRSMARDLANAIHVYLGDGKVSDTVQESTSVERLSQSFASYTARGWN